MSNIRKTARTLRWSVSTAVLAAAALTAGVAAAQDTPASTSDGSAPQEEAASVDDIVVTGFRSSLARAIDIKRDSDAQVDTILAEDIGKFPDLNLSESIQRIPGVALARDGGEGRNISVRGLGPQFTRVRINGMEALTTAGGTDASGGTNRGRSFDFNIFASDLFNAITVRKTAEATVEEGSLGATVDLRTARPFDYNDFTFVASGQASYNALVEKANPRGAMMIANTWADGRFGALFSVAYTKRELQDVGTSTVRWARGSAFAPGFDACDPAPAPLDAAHCGSNATLPSRANPDPTVTAYNAAFHPRFPRFDQYTSEQERLGATLSLQWRPMENTLLTFDALYADFKGTREEQFLEAPSFSVSGACTAGTLPNTCGIADTNVLSGTIDAHNTLIAGTFNDVDLRVEDRFDKLDTKFTQYTLTGEHSFSDSLKLDFALGTSKSDHNNPMQTTLTFDQFNVDGYHYDYSLGRVPLITYGTAQLNNPLSWKLTGVRLRPQTAVNSYDNATIDLTWKPNEMFRLEAGLQAKNYDFVTTEKRRSNGTISNQEAVVPGFAAAIPIADISQILQFNSMGLGMPGGNVNHWLTPDVRAAIGILDLNNPALWPLGIEPALGNNNSVSEEDRGGYIQGSWSTEIGGMPFRGNLGVRYVKTDQTAVGRAFAGGSVVVLNTARSYEDTLPSMNLVLEPRENFLVRFSMAKVMSRPNLGSLTPGATVNVSGANRTVTAGNPNLDPFRATTYDLSFEWYPVHGVILSLALFEKKIDSFVATQSTTSVFTGNAFGIPDALAIAACTGLPAASCNETTTLWTFSTPVNTDGGTLKGWELNYQQPLTFLPGFLANTGILFNYTKVESTIVYPGNIHEQLTGLSPTSYNATFYYEDNRWSARVSAAYREKYLTRVPGQEAGTDVDGTNETFNVDASAQYTLNDNMKLTFEGVNLTDEFQDQFNDSSNRVSFYHHTGREFLFGFRYQY